jgi:hypothetical protein
MPAILARLISKNKKNQIETKVIVATRIIRHASTKVKPSSPNNSASALFMLTPLSVPEYPKVCLGPLWSQQGA